MKTSVSERVREAGRERAREEARRIVDAPVLGPYAIGFDFARYASEWIGGEYASEWKAGFDEEVALLLRTTRSIVTARRPMRTSIRLGFERLLRALEEA